MSKEVLRIYTHKFAVESCVPSLWLDGVGPDWEFEAGYETEEEAIVHAEAIKHKYELGVRVVKL